MKLRFGASSFLNTAPLIEGLRERSDVTLIHLEPSKLMDELLNNRIDSAFVPIVDYLSNDSVELIDGIGVASLGNVKSVLLRLYKPLKSIKKIREDPASHTSNLLVKVLARELFEIDADIVNHETEEYDAEIVIGDKAFFKAPKVIEEIDLSFAWKELTGLPFVFAVWAYKNGDSRGKEIAKIIRESLEIGKKRIETIASRYSKQLGLSESFCLEYLTRSVYFELGEDELEAINEFRQKIIPFFNKELSR